MQVANAQMQDNAPLPHEERRDMAQDAQRKPPEISRRGLMSLLAGGVSGAIAWFASHMYAQDKLLEFEAEYKGRSVDLITGKSGLGAAAAETGSGLLGHPGYNNFGNLGPGMAGPLVEDAIATRLIQQHPEKYGFAKWMRRIGGKGTFSMGVGLATGTAVGLAAYSMLKDKGEQPESWQGKVETCHCKDKHHAIG